MAANGFHSEWVTIGRHRILLESRDSFPGEEMEFIGRVAAVACDHNSEHGARVVSVFFDDKSSTYNVKIASDDPEDEHLAEIVRTVLVTMFHNGNYEPQVIIVKPGNKTSDHYDHARYLSVQAGVAVDH